LSIFHPPRLFPLASSSGAGNSLLASPVS
jgi:hypothetical protein